MTDINGNDYWEERFHEVMYKMIERILANKEWCDKEDAFTVSLLLAEKNYQKMMYQRSSNEQVKTSD